MSYRIRDKQILDGISFSVEKGQFVALLGENGAGKTTLVDVIMGFRHASSGCVETLEFDSSKLDHAEARSRIAYLSERVDLQAGQSIGDFLEFHRFFYPKYDREYEKELLEVFKVKTSNRISHLSAGEVRRAQIVAALAARPELVIIDEITAVLDIAVRIKLMDLLKRFTADGGTVLMATNILEHLELVATDIVCLRGGQLAYVAKSEEIHRLAGEGRFSKKIAEVLEAA